MTNQTEIKRLARQIRRRFPGWKIDGLLLQDADRMVFRVSRNGQTAHLHAVSFLPRTQGASPQKEWHRRSGSYLAWIQMLCAMQSCEELALPSRCAEVSSFLKGRVKTVFALRPELLPLEAEHLQQAGPLETAQMLQALCQALRSCRDARIPHGELTAQHLMRKADGGYCLDGMLELQRLDAFDQLIPAESGEIQQAALLIRDLTKAAVPAETEDQAEADLHRLISRAAGREAGLTLEKMLAELEAIQEAMTHGGMSSIRDLTDLFSAEQCGSAPGADGKHAVSADDLNATVSVRSSAAVENTPPPEEQHAEDPDLEKTIGVRNPSYAPPNEAAQDEPEDDDLERTISAR